ncbi:hypothetical protein [Nannocystis pusilla]|uniref:hypothetical protein n=1 Tax=Nannocystis pusilla TaxID=889268 RepID=UPI003BF3617F
MSHEMTSTPARRSFTSTTFAAGFLALVALLVAGAGISDYLKFQGTLAETRERLQAAEATLAQVRFDPQGDVLPEDRAQYMSAMSTMESGVGTLRLLRASEANTYPYIGGGALAFLVLTIVAVRSTRRK